jgi:hypothetical protein
MMLTVFMANYKSHRDWQFVESMATALPAKAISRGIMFGSLRGLCLLKI